MAGLLNVVVVQAAVAEQHARGDARRAQEALTAVQESGRLASADLRRMLGLLHDPAEAARVEPAPGLDRVDELVALARASGLERRADAGAACPSRCPAGLDVSAYRIIQEALTNVVKHAHGARVDVELRYAPDAVEVAVRDSGGRADGGRARRPRPGRDARAHRALRRRAEAAPTPDGGFAVHARLPLEGAPA